MSNHELWRSSILPLNSTIKDAVKVLNDVALKIVLIADELGVFVGTVSDGDIRRGLLKGLDLTNSVASVVNSQALTVLPDVTRESVINMMTRNKVQQIPIVNELGHVTGLHLWNEEKFLITRPNTMIIMAGGKGTRLHPQTKNCPKPLLPIAGKPILEHIIERAKREGITNFIIAIHYLGHMIEDYFGGGDSFGVNIEYLREESPLGTAGALSLLEIAPAFPFLVTNGDVITNIRYGEILDFHVLQEARGTMAVRAHEIQNPFGVVQIEGINITGFNEKPISRSYINAGVYVLDPTILRFLKKSEAYDMPDLFTFLLKSSERVVAYPVYESWMDVGQPVDFLRAITETEN